MDSIAIGQVWEKFAEDLDLSRDIGDEFTKVVIDKIYDSKAGGMQFIFYVNMCGIRTGDTLPRFLLRYRWIE